MRLLTLLFAASFLIGIPVTHAQGNRPVEAKAKLVHLRGKRYQVRVVTTLPTGGFSKRPATKRRFHCVDDCQPFILVTAPIQAPPANAVTTQALTRIQHRKSIRIPRYWKAVAIVKVDGKTTHRFRLRTRDAKRR